MNSFNANVYRAAAADLLTTQRNSCCVAISFATDDLGYDVGMTQEDTNKTYDVLIKHFAELFMPEGLTEEDMWFCVDDYYDREQAWGMDDYEAQRAKAWNDMRMHRVMCLLLMADICEQGEGA